MKNVYFLGIGGIGMSALARYFMHEGAHVAGYDLTESALTDALSHEGADIHYTDSVEAIPALFRDKQTTLVVYTPAIPKEHSELQWFRAGGFEVLKRSEILGHVSEGKYVIAVSGTHGKTTTTTLTAWINRKTTGGGSAFLGGISKNFDSNLVLGTGDRLAVEADEFDRSFLRLHPDVAVVTAADADHLDIYGTHEAVKEAFAQFVSQIRKGGALVMKLGVDVKINNPAIEVYRYSVREGDFHAANIELLPNGHFRYDIICPDRTLTGVTLGVLGEVNIENSIAAVAAVWCTCKLRGEQFDERGVREALETFSGVRRRFDVYLNTPEIVYLDDYAHHPAELAATLRSLRDAFPGRKITAAFQPHLYTRTRDFHKEFAASLSLADRVVLIPIYPARELPIEGVCSEMIGRLVTAPCSYSTREHLAEDIAAGSTDIVVTFGAGNIEACCDSVCKALKTKYGI